MADIPSEKGFDVRIPNPLCAYMPLKDKGFFIGFVRTLLDGETLFRNGLRSVVES